MTARDEASSLDGSGLPAASERLVALVAAGRWFEARSLARYAAAGHDGPARYLLIAQLVAAYVAHDEAIRARRLQRWLVRRLPAVPELEQDYIGLLAATGLPGRAYARLLASPARRVNPMVWRPLETQLPFALMLSGCVEQAWALSAELVAASVRPWPVLVALAWSGGALGRLAEALDLVEREPPHLADDEDEDLAYRLIRTCAAHLGEARATRWVLSSRRADRFAWAAPYRLRAGLPALAAPERSEVLPLIESGAAVEAEPGPVNLVCDFTHAVGGAEEHVLDLAALLSSRVEVRVWGTRTVHPAYAVRGVRPISPDTDVRTGGVLGIVGGWHADGDWIDRFAPARVILFCNTLNAPQSLRLTKALGRRTGRPVELRFASDLVRREMALPGLLEISPIPPTPVSSPRGNASAGITVGRHSRDTFDKHHADDPAIYAALLDCGIRVRILGGTVLARRLPPRPGLDLLPAQPGATPAFLSTIDVMLYRTGAWTEACARAIFEAMREGIPVVVDDKGGHAEFIRHGIDGMVVRSSEDALERLLQLCGDAELRARLGRAGRERFLTFYGEEARASVRRRYLGPET